jgi:hypothetical protein
LELWIIFLYLLTKILKGAINTLAGSGTIVAFAGMLYTGIPLELANTTNRLGVLFQNISGTLAFRRHGRISIKIPVIPAVATLLGAFLGAYFAAHVTTRLLDLLALMVISGMLVYTFFDTFRKTALISLPGLTLSPFGKSVLFFLIGLYGGFIQIGVGILLLLGLRGALHLEWNQANYIKLLIVLIYTVPTTLYFVWEGMVLWYPGLTLAVGQIAGAYFSGWLFSIRPSLKQFIPYFILLMLVITAVKILFG